MILKQMVVGPMSVNCYFIGDPESKEIFIVDPGGNSKEIISCVRNNRYKVKGIISTHMHIDHVGAIPELCKALGTGYKFHRAEMPFVKHINEQALMFNLDIIELPKPQGFLSDGDRLSTGSLEILVLHTPGHSPGSLCLHCHQTNQIITGDTLFFESIGRTDLPGGNFETIINSIRNRIFTFSDSTTIFPGHGKSSTLLHEKSCNPFLKNC